jgi:EAL domain-containing protein (putative c-di-GMP-specific phosphodiesterase class I)
MTIPFESYAKLIRTIAPLVRKVLFYDGEIQPSWISDGMEEPEVHNAVMHLMSDRSQFEDDVASYGIGAARETFILCAVRTERGTLLGMLGVVCRTALAVNEPGRSQLTRRLLAPVLDLYKHSVSSSQPAATTPAPSLPVIAALKAVAPAPVKPADIYESVLRQSTTDVDCAFAAIVMPARELRRIHRISENESDVSMHAAVQAVHTALYKWMTFRRQPTLINRTSATARYKIAAAPILDHAGQVLGMMLLFREPTAADFTTSDLEYVCAACATLSSNGRSMRTPAQIRRALTDGDFRLYAQRISPLRKHSRAARFEVLLRMQNADAIYTPEAFLDVARTDRLMPEIDRWVVRHSLHALNSHAELLGDRNVEFCINVDEQSVITPGFADTIVAELEECSVPADLLVFEVGEPIALEKPAAVQSFADRISAAGCKLSLDHFGAGTGSMATLSRLHVSSVKIDGPLVRDVTTNRRSESVLRDVASMTASMHIETVAGRVEQDAVREKLQTLGIDYAQGFALSPPRPVDEALAELEYLRRAGRRAIPAPVPEFMLQQTA